MDLTVRKNEDRSRYEAVAGGRVVGIAAFRLRGSVVAIPHTEVDPELRGRGVAADLVKWALDDIRAMGASVDPQCSYVAEYVRSHPAYSDLVS